MRNPTQNTDATHVAVIDSVSITRIPGATRRIAAYSDGKWANVHDAYMLRPGAQVIAITVLGDPYAQVADLEAGALSVTQVRDWLRRARHTGQQRPCIYVEVSRLQSVVNELWRLGEPRSSYRLWSAHWTDVPHICSAACGIGDYEPPGMTQYESNIEDSGFDVSLTTVGWWAAVHGPAGALDP